ncbi:hypothetical protein DTU70_25895 [Salmonella enterica subsp. enterica serovar Weltevreden]|uniref:Uncharacterized protein n=3 Tax=root TaxID=1 RepID=A0A4P6WHR2_9ENTR|nr:MULTISPECIES: hypothetical protein [Citrobacter]EAX1863942.1 hypothetical protein [Salmonella enterica]EBX8806488.1 hypothetical protein [Salmonella enterica subsp. enterica serovar Weltevreden]ECK2164597.1 hypothetical protein [Salmonella enterica subsp. enterica]ECM3796966.1 hypothetical protein [Salmonella enterica subsp. enterica serovar Newport]EDW0192606.1 hypothetical protein [Salmonella enterica subsp. enterica serovar Orion]EDW2239410.1 hypothetical protein [Salmonella enterica su
MHTRNVNVKTAAQESSGRCVGTCPEPIAAKVLAFHGQDASYAFNVLADLKAAGASYTRRNIIADMFRRLGVN